MEYWHGHMEENIHFLPLRSASPFEDLGRVKALSGADIERVALEGFHYALRLLQPKKVREYLRLLLERYALLQHFNVAAVHTAHS